MDEQDLREIWHAEVKQEAAENNPLRGYCERVYFVSTSNGWRNGKQRRRKQREVELLKFLPSGRCVTVLDLRTPGLDALAEEVPLNNPPPVAIRRICSLIIFARCSPAQAEGETMISTNRTVMLEVDRRYHLNTTSDGRINHIADYVEEFAAESTRAALSQALEAVSAAPSQQHAVAAIRRLIDGEMGPLVVPDEIDKRMGDAG